MKKKMNNKGFALVETMVCAIFVCAIFMLLITNYYPLLGKVQRYQNYDESSTKYIAYHLGKLIEKNTGIFKREPSGYVEIFTASQICSNFTSSKQEQCNSFVSLANISKVYYTKYSTKDLKDHLGSINCSRAFELYAKYIPSYHASSSILNTSTNKTKEQEYNRLIIERKLVDEKNRKNGNKQKVIYKYANVEVKVGE